MYNGNWTNPVSVDSAPDGYTNFEVHTLDNGDVILLSLTMGRTLGIHRYESGSWSEVKKINNVFSFDGVKDGNNLLLMYATNTETIGVVLDGTNLVTSFNMLKTVSDIGITKTNSSDLLGVWRDGTNIYYAVVDL